jgi:hypothetical protein
MLHVRRRKKPGLVCYLAGLMRLSALTKALKGLVTNPCLVHDPKCWESVITNVVHSPQTLFPQGVGANHSLQVDEELKRMTDLSSVPTSNIHGNLRN